LPFPSAFLGGKEKDRKGVEEREKEMEDTGEVSVELEDPRLLSSDHWELLNVFRLSEIKRYSWEWMTVFPSDYLSTSCKV
jgi:hypothetical protein